MFYFACNESRIGKFHFLKQVTKKEPFHYIQIFKDAPVLS